MFRRQIIIVFKNQIISRSIKLTFSIMSTLSLIPSTFCTIFNRSCNCLRKACTLHTRIRYKKCINAGRGFSWSESVRELRVHWIPVIEGNFIIILYVSLIIVRNLVIRKNKQHSNSMCLLQTVSHNLSTSRPITVTSQLGPILFILFVLNLTNCLKYCKSLFFC